MPEWTDYQAAADKARRWADSLAEKGREEDALIMRLLADAAADKAADRAIAAVAEAPAQRDTRDGPPCAICGQPGLLSHGGETASCLNHDCIRFMADVAATMF